MYVQSTLSDSGPMSSKRLRRSDRFHNGSGGREAEGDGPAGSLPRSWLVKRKIRFFGPYMVKQKVQLLDPSSRFSGECRQFGGALSQCFTAVTFLFTKSRARTAEGPDLVVKRFWVWLAPRLPCPAASRAIRSRPMSMPTQRAALVTGTLISLAKNYCPVSCRRDSAEPLGDSM
jgi:hypothetical protein